MVVPTPFYVLRGHSSSVTSVLFDANEYLYSGDEAGFVICWCLTSMRPKCAWRAHTKTILGMQIVEGGALCTHGRDCRLVTWKIDFNCMTDNFMSLSKLAELQNYGPEASSEIEKSSAFISIHSNIVVNSLTFCPFSYSPQSKIVVLCNTLNFEELDVYDDESLYHPQTHKEDCGKRLQTRIQPEESVGKTGSVMSTSVTVIDEKYVLLAAGYESGHVVQYICSLENVKTVTLDFKAVWKMVYAYKSHSQPVLSVEYAGSKLFSTGADDCICLHPTPSSIADDLGSLPHPIFRKTKHCGQQNIRIRSDNKILATAGWDGRGRVYSCQTLAPLAVLKYHSDGINSLAFHPGSNVIALASKDTRISLWKLY